MMRLLALLSSAAFATAIPGFPTEPEAAKCAT